MSYTGVGVPAHGEATVRRDTAKVAARDIVRRNQLGQNVVIVPKGMPIPEGVAVDPSDVTDPAQAGDIAFEQPRRRPEPDIGGQQRLATRTQRQIWAFTRHAR